MGTPAMVRTTAERLFRNHIAEMREYASQIESVIGVGPIVKRIRSCAAQCEEALDRLAEKSA